MQCHHICRPHVKAIESRTDWDAVYFSDGTVDYTEAGEYTVGEKRHLTPSAPIARAEDWSGPRS